MFPCPHIIVVISLWLSAPVSQSNHYSFPTKLLPPPAHFIHLFYVLHTRCVLSSHVNVKNTYKIICNQQRMKWNRSTGLCTFCVWYYVIPFFRVPRKRKLACLPSFCYYINTIAHYIIHCLLYWPFLLKHARMEAYCFFRIFNENHASLPVSFYHFYMILNPHSTLLFSATTTPSKSLLYRKEKNFGRLYHSSCLSSSWLQCIKINCYQVHEWCSALCCICQMSSIPQQPDSHFFQWNVWQIKDYSTVDLLAIYNRRLRASCFLLSY